MKYYLLDENKNLIEGFDKEGFLALLEQAIEQGTLENIDEDSAVASKIRSVLNGTTHHIEFITQAQYNQLVADEELVANTWYFITDDTSYDELLEQVGVLQDKCDELEEHVQTGLRFNITSISCACDFRYWDNYGTSGSPNKSCLNLENHATYGQNAVNIFPLDTINSIAEASVDFVSGDEGYMRYDLNPISDENPYITFKLTALQVFNPPQNSSGVLKSATFKIHVRDIYGNVYEKEFTISFKASA